MIEQFTHDPALDILLRVAGDRRPNGAPPTTARKADHHCYAATMAAYAVDAYHGGDLDLAQDCAEWATLCGKVADRLPA